MAITFPNNPITGDTGRWFDKQLKWASKIEADGSKKLPILTLLYIALFFFGLFLH